MLISISDIFKNGLDGMGMSYSDAGRCFGVSQYKIEDWAQGRQSPPQYILSEIHKASILKGKG